MPERRRCEWCGKDRRPYRGRSRGMSADVPRGACLQCEQTREEVRINRTICGSDFTPTTDLIRCTYIVDVAEKTMA